MLATQITDWMLKGMTGKETDAPLSDCWMGLMRMEGETLVEPTATDYARTHIGHTTYSSSSDIKMDDPDNGTIKNKEYIMFNETQSAWGQVSYFGLFATETGGSALITGSLTQEVTIDANKVPLFNIGAFTITIRDNVE